MNYWKLFVLHTVVYVIVESYPIKHSKESTLDVINRRIQGLRTVPDLGKNGKRTQINLVLMHLYYPIKGTKLEDVP